MVELTGLTVRVDDADVTLPTLRLTRAAVLQPTVRVLRALSDGTARFPRARSLALSAALGVTAWPVVASLRALRPRRARTI